MKFKPGDKVKINFKGYREGDSLNRFIISPGMYRIDGNTLTVHRVFSDGTLQVKENDWIWCEEWLEPLRKKGEWIEYDINAPFNKKFRITLYGDMREYDEFRTHFSINGYDLEILKEEVWNE